MKDLNSYMNQARIAKLRHEVSQNSSLAPFMLFPVRLETHFRQERVSNKPAYENEIGKIFRMFLKVLDQLQNPWNQDDLDEKSIQEYLYDLRILIEELDLVSAEDKDVMISISSVLLNSVKRIFSPEQRLPFQKYIEKIVEISQEIEVSGALKRNKTTLFIKEFQKTFTALDTLSEYTKTAYRGTDYYTEPQNKSAENRKLYRYVTGRLLKISGFFAEALKELENLASLDNRQRTKLIKELYANNPNAWLRKFDKVSDNMQKIYQDFDFQQQKLMKKYEAEWKSLVKEAKENCENFIADFDETIVEKPFVAYPYLIVSKSIVQFQISIWEASILEEWISYQDLNERLERQQEILKNTQLFYTEEKVLIQDLQRNLKDKLENYLQLMKELEYKDYADEKRNKSLLKRIDFSSLEKLKTQNESYYSQNQLCVRIFPDNIFIHQHDNLLTKTEVQDGKEFWIKWFIASDNEYYEKEAWNFLCRKHEVEQKLR